VRTVELARGFQPQSIESLARRWDAEAGGSFVEGRARSPAEWRMEWRIERSRWRPHPERPDELWVTTLPGGAIRRADPRRARLRLGAQYAHYPRTDIVRQGSFRVGADGELVYRSRKGPPAEAVLEVELASGAEEDGLWSVRVGAHSGAGIPVWSGEREEVVARIPPACQLAYAPRHERASPETPVTFRVLLDGRVLDETTVDSPIERDWVELELPAQGLASARLAFEVDGPPGLGCFAAPVVAPRARGSYRARPWIDARANVVLVLADTFRADNLAAYGGDPEDAPNLNRLAEESVRFLAARASASWTLPSLPAVLTGCYPAQFRLADVGNRLPEEALTLAERFARAGYRTGAVTDGVYFTPSYGLAQGFGWFLQRPLEAWSLRESLEDVRSFLAGDDGRPVFLVVHTYRAHGPYRTGDEESDAGWRAFKAELRERRLESGNAGGRKRRHLAEHGGDRISTDDVLLSMQSESLALYRQGVRALDRGFGELRALLDELGLLEHGYLVFTADHGEAFGENGVVKHGGNLWDSRLRVPLLVHGHDLVPRSVPWSVSNVDVAPTLADLLGLERDPRWPGASLLAADRDRTVLAFQLRDQAGDSSVAVIEGRRKVLASLEDLERERPGSAFDLALDPREERDVAATAEWAAELARRGAPAVRALLQDRAPEARVELDPADLDALDELGYVGGE
jgi:arylsulfatase